MSMQYQAGKWREWRNYQLKDFQLIQYQILPNNIVVIVWQTPRRITNEILGMKGLKGLKVTTHTELWTQFFEYLD